VISAAIVGAGRLGTVLGRALRKKRIAICGIADRSLAAARESRAIIGMGAATRSAVLAAASADIVFITVPDDAIGRMARLLAEKTRLAAGPRARVPKSPWRGKIVFHTSGAVSSEALAPLRAAGAACASFHPVQTFPRKDLAPSVFKGATIDLEGDPRAVHTGAALARMLGARPIVLRTEDKALFHAAGGIASNLFIPLFDAACRLLGEAGISDRDAVRILLPLAEGTLQSVKRLDRASALTGPISRGDVETVRRHLDALRPYPAALRIYRVLGSEALALVNQGGRVRPAAIRAMARLLAGKLPLPRGRA
jgi:predicted short-subunit dehydrogenase-like oxidoreductase (DUF2520 family)